MSLYFADDSNQISFGVQASNASEVAQFSSTLDNVIMRMFTNNGSNSDNLTTGVAIGSSNYDKTATASNNLYFGHIAGGSNIKPVLLMQDSKIAVNTIPYSNYSLTVQNGGTYTDTLSTPWIVATNYDQTFSNIAADTYIDYATVTTAAANSAGVVPFTLNFNGVSSQYNYNLKFISGGTIAATSGPQTSYTRIANYSQAIATGTYTIQIGVTTPGSGTGSSYYNSNAGSFTVGTTDTVSTPTVSLNPGTATFSSNNFTYVSGVPFYGSGTTVTFPPNALSFTNMYGTIDPRTLITNAMTFSNINSGTIKNFTYANIYTNVTQSSSANDNSLTFTLSGTVNGTVEIDAVVRNTANITGVAPTTLMSLIAYLGTAPDETNLPASIYTGMPITAVTRMSIPTVVDPTNLAGLTLGSLVSYTGIPSSHDAFYSPFDGKYYTQQSQVVRGGGYAPTLLNQNGNAQTGTRPYLVLKLTTAVALTSFVLTLANSTGISSVYVAWDGVNGGAWYDPNVMYNASPSGCGAATPTGVRYPINLPQDQTLSGKTDVYIYINFSGYINLAGITVTYA
jgi:hypothetical protein